MGRIRRTVAANPSNPSRRTGIVRRVAIGAVVVTLATLGACGGGGSESGAGDDAGATVDSAQPETRGAVDGLGSTEALDDAESQPEGTPARPGIQTRLVISTGEVTLEADDLGEARAELDRLLGRFGGYVSDERTSTDDEGEPTRSLLTLRVPSQYFDQLMGSVDEFSTVTDTSRQAVDVTTEVIDVDARIRTQEVSLERLRKFLGRAQRVITIIRLESEIAQREAELASLRAQQRYLDDQTSLATVTVTMLRTDADTEPTEDDPLEHAGFLSGLRSGWDALVGVLVVAATVVGALVPFALVIAAVGVPAWLWFRASRRRRTA